MNNNAKVIGEIVLIVCSNRTGIKPEMNAVNKETFLSLVIFN